MTPALAEAEKNTKNVVVSTYKKGDAICLKQKNIN